jgi:HSP20 family protein
MEVITMAEQHETTTKHKADLSAERTRDRETFVPPVDIYETDDKITLLADMPGVSGENVDIELKNGTLTLLGRAKPVIPDGFTALYSEYPLGDYSRTFAVSEAVDQEHITAEMSDGVLTLALPKVKAQQPHTIKVKTKVT